MIAYRVTPKLPYTTLVLIVLGAVLLALFVSCGCPWVLFRPYRQILLPPLQRLLPNSDFNPIPTATHSYADPDLRTRARAHINPRLPQIVAHSLCGLKSLRRPVAAAGKLGISAGLQRKDTSCTHG